MTFSVVARDPETEAVGVAVQSKFVSVGSVVPFAGGDAGADELRLDGDADGVLLQVACDDGERHGCQIGCLPEKRRRRTATGRGAALGFSDPGQSIGVTSCSVGGSSAAFELVEPRDSVPVFWTVRG